MGAIDRDVNDGGSIGGAEEPPLAAAQQPRTGSGERLILW
jgi:hypothetical protein